jgi:hypothetical protein
MFLAKMSLMDAIGDVPHLNTAVPFMDHGNNNKHFFPVHVLSDLPFSSTYSKGSGWPILVWTLKTKFYEPLTVILDKKYSDVWTDITSILYVHFSYFVQRTHKEGYEFVSENLLKRKRLRPRNRWCICPPVQNMNWMQWIWCCYTER